MSGVIAITRPVIRRRYPTGAVIRGRWQPGTPVEDEIQVNLQPLRGDELQILPEGERSRVTFKVYTEADLVGVNEADQRDPDELLIDGQVFEVHQVWDRRRLLPHIKAIIVRREVNLEPPEPEVTLPLVDGFEDESWASDLSTPALDGFEDDSWAA